MAKARKIKLPKILNIPPKLYPIIFDFNKYSLFLLEGGRGSAKTHSVGRLILWLAEQRKIKVCCGRVIKDSVKHSVFALFKDLIEEYNLDYDTSEEQIVHRKTGSVIFFKGFREQEIVNIKGLEGVDILWIDEAKECKRLNMSDYNLAWHLDKDPKEVGCVWLLCTEDIVNHKICLLRELKKEFLKYDKKFWYLYNFIYYKNSFAKNWLKWVGFKFDMPHPIGLNIPKEFEFFYRVKKLKGLNV